MGGLIVMRGEASVPVGDVKPGAHVAIFSTKLADGTAAASEINIVDEGSDAAPRAHGHPHGEADEPSK